MFQWLKTAISRSSSAPSLDGTGGTNSAAKVGTSTKARGPTSYGACYLESSTADFNGLILFMQYITVYTPNSVHLNQITPSTATTVSSAAFRRNRLPLLIPWRLSSGPCANSRASRSPTRRFSSHRSQAQHPKKTLPASLCTVLPDQACPNTIRSCWLSSRRRGPRRSRSRTSCRNALMIPISITASLVHISYPNSTLTSFAVYYRVYSSEGGDKKADVL